MDKNEINPKFDSLFEDSDDEEMNKSNKKT